MWESCVTLKSFRSCSSHASTRRFPGQLRRRPFITGAMSHCWPHLCTCFAYQARTLVTNGCAVGVLVILSNKSTGKGAPFPMYFGSLLMARHKGRHWCSRQAQISGGRSFNKHEEAANITCKVGTWFFGLRFGRKQLCRAWYKKKLKLTSNRLILMRCNKPTRPNLSSAFFIQSTVILLLVRSLRATNVGAYDLPCSTPAFTSCLRRGQCGLNAGCSIQTCRHEWSTVTQSV